MRLLRFDKGSIALILSACALYYFHFYNTTWDIFSLDANAHVSYVTHIVQHGTLPEESVTGAARHPPTYYIAAAGLYKLAMMAGAQDPLMVVRHLSMMLFMVFAVMSALLLRRMLPLQSAAYYAPLAILLFWPIGVTMGGRISCDIFLYACEAGTLYYTVCWLQTKMLKYLALMFFWCGLTVLAKNAGVILLGIGFSVLLCALFQYRRTPRIFLRFELLASILFTLVCTYLTVKHGWVISHIHGVLQSRSFSDWWSIFTGFNAFLFLYDNDMGISQDMFWNMVLHSLLLGHVMPWRNPDILIAFNILWFAIIIYILESAFRFKLLSLQDKRIMQFGGLFTLIMIASMVYMWRYTGNFEYEDSRYIYPVIIIIALYYGKAMELHQQAGNNTAYRIGVDLAAMFALSSVVLFVTQYILTTH